MNFEKMNNGDPFKPEVSSEEMEKTKKELEALVEKFGEMSPEQLDAMNEAMVKAVEKRKEQLAA